MKQVEQSKSVSDIRITDPYLVRQISAEQEKQGDATATKTAGRLILERLRELELERKVMAPSEHASSPAA
jgi:hypothetical protein